MNATLEENRKIMNSLFAQDTEFYISLFNAWVDSVIYEGPSLLDDWTDFVSPCSWDSSRSPKGRLVLGLPSMNVCDY